jgi:hypothetical protein
MRTAAVALLCCAAACAEDGFGGITTPRLEEHIGLNGFEKEATHFGLTVASFKGDPQCSATNSHQVVFDSSPGANPVFDALIGAGDEARRSFFTGSDCSFQRRAAHLESRPLGALFSGWGPKGVALLPTLYNAYEGATWGQEVSSPLMQPACV